MPLPQQLPPNALGECPYVPFAKYDWSDNSCNFHEWAVHIPWNPAVYCLFASLHGVAIWMALELVVRTLARFKRKHTLYFWSLMGVSCGIICHTVAFILRTFVAPNNSVVFMVPYAFGQILTLSGFGLVLYSRLHLIVQNRLLLRCLLLMIVVVGVIGHTTTIIQLIVTSTGNQLLVIRIYHAVGYLDVIFSAQDLVLSSFYVYYFWKYLHEVSDFGNEKTKKKQRTTFGLIIFAYTWSLLSDVLIDVLLCKEIWLAKILCAPLVCAIKLNLEFFVLNRLVQVGTEGSRQLGRQSVGQSLTEVKVDLSSVVPDVEDANSMGRDPFMTVSPPGSVVKVSEAAPEKVNSRQEWRTQVEEIHPYSSGQPSCEVSGDTLTPEREGRTKNSVEDLERQYLGQFQVERS